jgi:hypothetical protein
LALATPDLAAVRTAATGEAGTPASRIFDGVDWV